VQLDGVAVVNPVQVSQERTDADPEDGVSPSWFGHVRETHIVYLRWSYDRCERILAPSDATRTMLAHSGIAPSRIDIWRRGVSTTLFDPRKRSAGMRERWGVSDRRPALVYVGRLSKEKGLHALVPITWTLDYGGIEYRLVIIGDGQESACRVTSHAHAIASTNGGGSGVPSRHGLRRIDRLCEIGTAASQSRSCQTCPTR
jgi:glycosyltransferase involved in cell wall biosynthesis